MNLTPIFNQYLRYTSIPTVEYRINRKQLECRWITEEPNFLMPIDIRINGTKHRIYAGTAWIKSKLKVKTTDSIEVIKKGFFIN